MIYYTVVPMEYVLEEQEDERSLVHAAVNGCPVLVEPLGEGRGRIERILSTDPSQYLTLGLQPGSIVDLIQG